MERGFGADDDRAAEVGDFFHRGSCWIQHVGVHSDLSKLDFRVDRQRDELVAREWVTIFLANAIVLVPMILNARGHAIWHSVSGVLPGEFWDLRRECAGDVAGTGGLRVVWNSNVDWWSGGVCVDVGLFSVDGVSGSCEGAGDYRASISVLHGVLGNQRGGDPRGNRIDSHSAGNIKTPVADCVGIAAAGMGIPGGGRVWADAVGAFGIRARREIAGAILASLLAVADGDDRILGDAVIEHSGFFTLCKNAARTGAVGQAAQGCRRRWRLYSFIGVAVTSATPLIFGRKIWDPIELLQQFKSPAVLVIAMLSIALATLATNIAANVVSPANDFANLAPRFLGFRGGGLITAFIGVLMMPWRLLETSGSYIFIWLGGYSALLGAVGGILICDYWLLRRRRLNVADLYKPIGEYTYTNGVNWRAIIALVISILTCVPGFLAKASGGKIMMMSFLHPLYPYAWFVTFFLLAFVIYYVLMIGTRKRILPRITQKKMEHE